MAEQELTAGEATVLAELAGYPHDSGWATPDRLRDWGTYCGSLSKAMLGRIIGAIDRKQPGLVSMLGSPRRYRATAAGRRAARQLAEAAARQADRQASFAALQDACERLPAPGQRGPEAPGDGHAHEPAPGSMRDFTGLPRASEQAFDYPMTG